MRTLRYTINVGLDGSVDHTIFDADEELHRFHAESLGRADALLFGRVTYEMMEGAWRKQPDGWPEWMPEWTIPFAETIDASKKYVVSSTLESVDWNSELVSGDVGEFVRRLKEEPGGEILVGGVTLPLALADQGLIDVYELLVLPVIAGHGPRLLDGLQEKVDLELVDRRELQSGGVALRYHPKR